MVMKRDKLMRNPEREFKDPERLMEDQELSEKQKIELLVSWRWDLLELERATEENMGGTNDTGQVAEQLRKVNRALEKLGAEADGESPL